MITSTFTRYPAHSSGQPRIPRHRPGHTWFTSPAFFTSLTFLTFLLPFSSTAQVLTPEQAVAIALEKNHGIQVARLQAQSAAELNSAGNAGMLPTLDANGAYSINNAATKQTFFSGEVREADNADSRALSGAVSLNWTIFDGLAMFAAKDRLAALEGMGKIQLRQEVEATVYDVLTSYYLSVQVKKALEAQRDAIQITGERLEIVRTGLRVGTSSGLAEVQARLDLSADSMAILNLEEQLATAYTRLNLLLGRATGTPVEVADEIPAALVLDLGTIQQQARADNAALQQARQARLLGDLQVKELRGALFPRLDVYGNYGYNRSTSSVGFLMENTAFGPDYGVRASVPLFHGQRANKALKVARIQSEQARISAEEAQLQVDRQVQDAWSRYTLANQRVALGRKDLEGIRTQVDVALESYRLGMITAVELRDVQQSMLDAENRLLLAQYEAKSAELQLRLLAGTILQ
ncbi:MAG: TolC family protein [Flavobacteriales bacterium]|nr:TolC family protein [Flavobacteriales bacterium]MEB2341741.1 TolC family protein [Flavobacteriia bacterium]